MHSNTKKFIAISGAVVLAKFAISPFIANGEAPKPQTVIEFGSANVEEDDKLFCAKNPKFCEVHAGYKDPIVADLYHGMRNIKDEEKRCKDEVSCEAMLKEWGEIEANNFCVLARDKEMQRDNPEVFGSDGITVDTTGNKSLATALKKLVKAGVAIAGPCDDEVLKDEDLPSQK